ncbi:MAG: F0F1 ATP synthase subunit gamma, partial [Deltaproteobacteria bacterium]|nr:F0F1 ATP synthase subunit gamma [Deltaproteobacteria bacterium]
GKSHRFEHSNIYHLSSQARESKFNQIHVEYLFEPDVKTLLASLLPKVVEVGIYRALLEAVASEHGARMTAMDSATTNAAEMISSLTLQMNRARQASITRELMEIVSTAEALK